MRDLNNYLKNKSIDNNKLIKYGFVKKNKDYIYETTICDEQFKMIVTISNKQNASRLIDLANGDEYILTDIQDVVGEFVGSVREEYEEKLQDIFKKCTNPNIFKSNQTKEIIEYIRKKYEDELEFLWEKYDNNAIWRNKKNNKWYGVILTIKEEKLKSGSDKEIEIIDLRYEKEKTEEFINNETIFPGYHMNKKSWITVKLDYSVNTKTIFDLIDNSYNLSIGNKCGTTADELSKRVLEYLTTIPKGKVVTYKQVAEYLGNKGLARVVGSILHKNPDGDKYPCYKVLNSKGELAEAFVFGGKDVQKIRLEKEGIKVVDYKVDLKKYQWK